MENSKKTLVGLDIGGTKIAAILYKNGKVANSLKIKTPKSRRRFFDAIVRAVSEVSADGNIKGIGIGVAGAVDARRGIVKRSPNLPFLKNEQLAKILQKKLKKPVRIDNDTNCFLRGEMNFGQAKGKETALALTLGTGVGGAAASRGEIMRGSRSSAYELGHIRILKENGKYLSIEDLVSEKGFRRLKISDPLDCQLKAEKRDKKSIQIYNEVGEYLGVALANLINIFDPELIVLGGGIARAGNLLLRPAKKQIKKNVIVRDSLPPIKISRLDHAAELGAAALFTPEKSKK